MKSTDVTHLYSAQYFLKQVDGCAEFGGFDGSFQSLHARYQRNILLSTLKEDDHLLEIGCGRGEICIFHALRGGVAVGIDYSKDAIELAKTKAQSLAANAWFVNQSFHEIVEPDNSYDKIIASEFIEHISREEGDAFMKIAYRLLKPGGKILLFTHPNTFQRKFGYPILRVVGWITGRRLPKQQDDTTDDHYRLYHLNEQNYRSLYSLAKRHGFNKVQVGYDSPQGGHLRQLVMATPLRHIFACDLFMLAEK